MTDPKPHVGKTIGGHLFIVDEKYCDVFYRGVIVKETDKSFLIEDKNWRGSNGKVLKSKHYVVAPPDADPKQVLAAFETVKKTFASSVIILKSKLAAEQARQFESSLAALRQAAGVTPDEEEIGTTSTE